MRFRSYPMSLCIVSSCRGRPSHVLCHTKKSGHHFVSPASLAHTHAKRLPSIDCLSTPANEGVGLTLFGTPPALIHRGSLVCRTVLPCNARERGLKLPCFLGSGGESNRPCRRGFILHRKGRCPGPNAPSPLLSYSSFSSLTDYPGKGRTHISRYPADCSVGRRIPAGKIPLSGRISSASGHNPQELIAVRASSVDETHRDWQGPPFPHSQWHPPVSVSESFV